MAYIPQQSQTELYRTAHHTVNVYNMAAAGIAMGILILPPIASLSEDALSSVPQSLRAAMNEQRAGELIEYAPTQQIFQSPRDQRTEQYISGRFG